MPRMILKIKLSAAFLMLCNIVIVLLYCLGIKYPPNNITASNFMKRSVIANWKMHFSLKEAVEFCEWLCGMGGNSNSSVCHPSYGGNPDLKISPLGDYDINHSPSQLIIAAPTPYLAHLAHLFPHLSFATQDVSAHESYGAHTGEVSAKQLASCGVCYCIIGHPERRRDFGEDDELVKRKADNCLNAGLMPIICLGSDLSLAKEFGGDCMIAYEPEGSIGTGVIPDGRRLIEVFGELKSMVAKSVNLVYGGSVNLGNLSAIKSAEGIDSILLGRASLKAEDLREILKNW